MYNPETKQGVLNNWDLAQKSKPNRKPSTKDKTGTMPFLALDLLNKEAFCGLVLCRYCYNAKSFNWCLIYIFVCMDKDNKGHIGTINPHPLLEWFTDITTSFYSKTTLSMNETLWQSPLYQGISYLVVELYSYWMDWFNSQSKAKLLASKP